MAAADLTGGANRGNSGADDFDGRSRNINTSQKTYAGQWQEIRNSQTTINVQPGGRFRSNTAMPKQEIQHVRSPSAPEHVHVHPGECDRKIHIILVVGVTVR
jgi:hypothetical protein